MQFKDYQNVHEMLYETVEKYADDPAYRWFNDDLTEVSVTWNEYDAQVKQVAKSLMALGLEKGDKFNILSYTCYRWVLTDMAAMSIGAVTVGIYQSNLPKDCGYIITHSDSVVVFAENEAQLAKLREIREEIPNVRKVILIKGDAPAEEKGLGDHI